MFRCCAVLTIVFALIFPFVLMEAALANNAETVKLPIPDAAVLRAARGKVNETFAEEIAKARKPGEKSAVAKKLLKTADETANDAAVRYTALSMARELALSDGDADAALTAVAGLEAFAIDDVKLKADTLIAILKTTGSPQDTLVGPLVDEAVGADRFPVARQLAEAALSTAKQAGDAGAIANANAWILEIREIESASGPAGRAAAALSTKPGDSAASTTLGRFEAFLKNRWDKALPLLAAGNDVMFKTLAESELAAAQDPVKQVQVADGWWQVAAKERAIARSHIREHAARLYKTALPSLSGLEKAKAENRIKEGAVVRASYTGWIDLMRKVNLDHDVIRGKWSVEPGKLTMSSRALMKLAARPGKNYEVRVQFSRLDSIENGGRSIALVLPVADAQVSLQIDPLKLGLERVDGKQWSSGETLRAGAFGGANKKHLIDVTIWQDPANARILVLVDGKQFVDWTGASAKLSNSGDFHLEPSSLGIGSWDAPLTVHGIALRESDSEAQ